LGVNGGAWSWVRIDIWGPVDRGVVHGRGLESLNFGVNGGVVHGRGFEYLTFWVNGGVVVHGRGFESLNLRVRILDFLVVNCGVHPQNQQSQPNPTQTIEATCRPVLYLHFTFSKCLFQYHPSRPTFTCSRTNLSFHCALILFYFATT
jgi:hypothetical protein